MPRYRLPNGVVVETSEENAAQIMGITPEGSAPSTPKKEPAKKAPAKKTG